MGVCASNDDQGKISIEHTVFQRNRKNILLLGTHESGKTTLVRQLLLHYKQISETERKGVLSQLVQQSIVGKLSTIAQNIVALGDTLPAQLHDAGRRFIALAHVSQGKLTLEMQSSLESFLKHKDAICGILEADQTLGQPWELGGLVESAIRIAAFNTNYTPTDKDILSFTWHTVGTITVHIDSSAANLLLIDTGGLIRERKKWHSLKLDPSTTVLFVVALDSFASHLAEDQKVNRMQDSLWMCQQACQREELLDKPILLVFTKQDRLADALASSEGLFREVFPQYEGPMEPDSAAKFISSAFMDLIPNAAGRVNVMITNLVDRPEPGRQLQRFLQPDATS